MRPDFIFRSGKYAGKTYSYVRRVDPRWLSWVEVNRPEMLREKEETGAKASEVKTETIPWANPEIFQQVSDRLLRARGED